MDGHTLDIPTLYTVNSSDSAVSLDIQGFP